MVSVDDMRVFKRARLLHDLDEVIRLEVGGCENLTKFTVHKTVLCPSSPFFESAYKPEWMTAEERVIRLPNDDPIAVRAMVYWMYHNIICISGEMDELEIGNTEEDAMKSAYGLLAKLYILGEKFQMPRLRNDAIDAILYRYESTGSFDIGINSYVYANTSGDSPLRKLLVHIALDNYNKPQIGSFKEMLCGELIFDLAKVPFSEEMEVEKARTGYGYPIDDFCNKFHVHPINRVKKCENLTNYVLDS
ncbi:hypothetical protein ONS95_011377 [Cadophora gregata]|uniref:uncharacterized protein n=1 Tax=Cadophora gregata TaxID=51156 RepID=UPI0026DAA816|nr:uncharacterized protein ONS95_011377 [Cadophora gregata]KAK0119953.1 hypothetical protein ONS95_011377 [Cadophora gregata]KAK0120988.1 hypothetical protein ONS96_011179 [Cadophora gregata f. sp. sojae]